MALAQQPTPPPQPPVLAPYRAPAIALVQPPAGGTVPQDKPVVVFRFAPGEPDDPIDASSFAIAVDGTDRTALFQLATAEAWGSLAPAPSGRSGAVLAAGAHLVEARICSARGACAALSATVTAVPGAQGPTTPAPNRRARLIDVLLNAARKLLSP